MLGSSASVDTLLVDKFTRRILPIHPFMALLRESVLELLRKCAFALPRRGQVVDPFDCLSRAEFRARGITVAIVAFKDLLRLFVPDRVPERTRLDTHFAADAFGLVEVHPAGSGVPGQRVRGANRDARGVPTVLTHHRDGKAFALPSIDVNAGRIGAEGALMRHRTC